MADRAASRHGTAHRSRAGSPEAGNLSPVGIYSADPEPGAGVIDESRYLSTRPGDAHAGSSRVYDSVFPAAEPAGTNGTQTLSVAKYASPATSPVLRPQNCAMIEEMQGPEHHLYSKRESHTGSAGSRSGFVQATQRNMHRSNKESMPSAAGEGSKRALPSRHSREKAARPQRNSEGRRRPQKHWMVLLHTAKKKCKHAAGSPKFIEACRTVLAVQQRFSRLWLHLQESRGALDALLGEVLHSKYGGANPNNQTGLGESSAVVDSYYLLPPDQAEEERLAELADRFRLLSDEIESISQTDCDNVDWATLGLYVRYRREAGHHSLEDENINLQEWKAIEEQLGKTEAALTAAHAHESAAQRREEGPGERMTARKGKEGSDGRANGRSHGNGELATAARQGAESRARELALCRAVRELVRDLLERFTTQQQWRLLLEFLRRACSLQDFLERKRREWLAQPDVPFEESFFGSYGPVGDLPLHLIFLMGLDVFCKDCILSVYAVPGTGRLDLPYISDLWMALDEESGGVALARARWTKEGWLRPGEEDVSSMGMFTGETVLHIAIAKRRCSGLLLLLEHGVDLSCRTSGQFFAPDRVMPFRRPRRKAASLLDPLLAQAAQATLNRNPRPDAPLEPPIAEERYTFTELLKVTSFGQMWDGGYPLLQNPMSGFYGGELPLSFAAAVDDTRIMGMLLDNLKDGVWREWETLTEAERREDRHKKKHKRYLLTVNPAVRNAMAAGEVEQRQLQEAWHETRGNFINAKDSFGNTALHLAVIHGRKDAVDWLIENGAISSLTMLNVNGYTPFTLTAALGSTDMFMHILTKHMRRILWSYGPISSVHTNLAQVDSFRMTERREAAHRAAYRTATVKALSGSHWWSVHRCCRAVGDFLSTRYEDCKSMGAGSLRARRRRGGDEDDYFEDWQGEADGEKGGKEAGALEEEDESDEQVSEKFNEKTMAALHSDPNWRSALEIIIHQEIEDFMAGEEVGVRELVKDLVRQKWDGFGRRMHITKRVMPYLSFVIVWTTICVFRSSQVHVDTVGDGELSDVQEVARAVLEGFVIFLMVPILLRSAWSNMRTKISDLDVNLDGCIETNEKILFLYKNMSSLLDLFSALCIVFCGFLRAAKMQDLELDIMAIVSVVIWCNVLTCFVPFKTFGTMVITIHKMLVGDVAIFLVVYILINGAFGLAIFLCMQGGEFPQDIELQEQLRCVGCDRHFPNMVLKLVWVSLGETEQTQLLQKSRSPALAACLHIVFVVLSLILLLNLIIAMMGDTYQKQFNQAEKDWFFPYADLVLRYESKLSQRHRVKYRAGTPISLNNKQRHLGPAMTFHWREELLQG